jgi:hypothetical protein
VHILHIVFYYPKKGGVIIPLTPYEDKQVFWQRIRDEPKILSLMGWTNATPTEMAKNIILRKPDADLLTASKKQIAIYNAPSRKAGSVHFADCVIEVDITVPIGESKSADLAAKEIIKIMKCTKVNNRQVFVDADLGDYTAPAGFYCHAMRFNFYSSI